jgi:hypothetical protein
MIPLRIPLPPALFALRFQTRHRRRSARPTSLRELARQLRDRRPLAGFSGERDRAGERYFDRIGPLIGTGSMGHGWATVRFRVVWRVGFFGKRTLSLARDAPALI